MLERSVRIRWHFRDSDRVPSKFYVPKPDWQPRPSQRNFHIEEGLRKAKGLLFERISALTPSEIHRSNPELREMKAFLQSNRLIVKITDKNLGLAVLDAKWYHTQCEFLLADVSTYDSIDENDVRYFQQEAVNRIEALIQSSQLPTAASEFLLASKHDMAIPEFHCIPKVHKESMEATPYCAQSLLGN